jgi:hypothetical protein
MGQYYIAIILADKGTDTKKEYIRLCVHPHTYNFGAKLMEHCYIDTEFTKIVEGLLCPQGMFYKSRLVWAGDYADAEQCSDDEKCCNLYGLTNTDENAHKNYEKGIYFNKYFRYIVNHTQKMFVDKDKCNNQIHPLPLLTSEGNGLGGGDYRGNNVHLCGTWARDTVSMESSIPEGYNELVCHFEEY